LNFKVGRAVSDHLQSDERARVGPDAAGVAASHPVKDFLYRSALPTGEDEALQENPKFWELIESARLPLPKED
jgi:hypothetical protein